MHHLAEAKRQVGDEVAGGNHAAHGQAGDVAIACSKSSIAAGPDHAPFNVTSRQVEAFRVTSRQAIPSTVS
jgi:hypothetical protein